MHISFRLTPSTPNQNKCINSVSDYQKTTNKNSRTRFDLKKTTTTKQTITTTSGVRSLIWVPYFSCVADCGKLSFKKCKNELKTSCPKKTKHILSFVGLNFNINRNRAHPHLLFILQLIKCGMAMRDDVNRRWPHKSTEPPQQWFPFHLL